MAPRSGRLRAGWGLGVALSVALAGCRLVPAGAARARREKEVAVHTATFAHGFRHDPMQFVESVYGIASDGQRLWALDAQGKRLCVIERALAEEGTGR